jgi:TonB-linked SusC/RagA family outer membrane protein
MKKQFLNVSLLTCLLFVPAAYMSGKSYSKVAENEKNVEQQKGIVASGVVTDENGEPLIGVTITSSSKKATVTDIDGRYSIPVNQGEQLTFSYVGFVSQTLLAQQTLNVQLAANTTGLDEVVVIGYGTLEKKNVTSSISSISAKELPSGVGGASIANAMKGKVSSLSINETPSPNSGTSFQLRGMASVNASASPLVVIDGMPGGDIKSIAQEDIQSIDILKDAAAGSIYGTRATGGVILITTKQAAEGKIKLSYTGEIMFKKAFGKPRVMNAEEYLKYRPGATDYGYDVDWWAEGMSDNPTSYRHVITLQGGAKDARVYATAMYEDNKGVLMYDTRKDLGGRINANFKVLDGWLDINARASYRQAKRNQANPNSIADFAGQAGFSYPPTQPMIGTLLGVNPTRSPYDASQWDTKNGLDDPNTIIDAGLVTNTGLEKWFQPGVEFVLNVKPIDGLTFHQTLGYENHQYEWQYYAPSTTTVTEYQNRSGQGTAFLDFNKVDKFNSDGYFSYVRQFNDDHYLNAAAGYSYYEQNGEWFGVRNLGFAVDGTAIWNIGSGMNLNNPKVSDGALQAQMGSYKAITNRLMAYFGRANYSFKDRYLAAATIRREASSKFAVNKRWGTFWQVSGAWRFSRENFMKNITFFDDLKLRASYGITGSEGFSGTYAATMYSSGGYWLLPGGDWAYSYGISKNINPNLGWEEKHEWNIGLDYEFLNRRFFGKIDFYRREQVGLLYEVNVPQPPYPLPTMMQNIGTLKNTGWEFEFGGQIFQNKDWSYNTKINISHNSTKVGKMTGEGSSRYIDGYYIGRAGTIHRLQEGGQVGAFYLYRFAGFDENGLFQAYDKDGKIIVPEKDGKRDEDKVQMGNYIPAAVVGWSHDLFYKNWTLGITLTSWIDFDIYNAIEHVDGTTGGLPGAFRNQLLDAFTKNAHIKGQTLECDYFLEDGTFLKVQNLTLGYKLNTKKWTKLMDSARFYFTANNLFTISKYSGLNPEVDITGWNAGIESVVYPQTRTFAIGVQLNF